MDKCGEVCESARDVNECGSLWVSGEKSGSARGSVVECGKYVWGIWGVCVSVGDCGG